MVSVKHTFIDHHESPRRKKTYIVQNFVLSGQDYFFIILHYNVIMFELKVRILLILYVFIAIIVSNFSNIVIN